MAATARLTAPNGVEVTVTSDKVENLVRHGFTEAKSTKAPAKKAASSKKKSASADD